MINHWDEIMKAMPELETFVPCYDQDDHLNQMGMLKCSSCNPDGWEIGEYLTLSPAEKAD